MREGSFIEENRSCLRFVIERELAGWADPSGVLDRWKLCDGSGRDGVMGF